jgi:hypothetical protein
VCMLPMLRSCCCPIFCSVLLFAAACNADVQQLGCPCLCLYSLLLFFFFFSSFHSRICCLFSFTKSLKSSCMSIIARFCKSPWWGHMSLFYPIYIYIYIYIYIFFFNFCLFSLHLRIGPTCPIYLQFHQNIIIFYQSLAKILEHQN